MGSFLMACAVTGATITDGADVVAFPMQLERGEGRGHSDTMNCQWFISEMPIHGMYNDYGNVLDMETKIERNAADDNLMIMYRWARQVLVDIVEKSNLDNDLEYARLASRGKNYVNYHSKKLTRPELQSIIV